MKRLMMAALLLLLVLFCSACAGNEPEIQDGAHPRESQYRAEFETKDHDFDGWSLHIQEDLFDAELANTISEQIESDFDVLKGAAGTAVQEITIYIVDETINGKPQVVDQELFCTREDIASGTYRQFFIQAALGVTCDWESFGLTQYLYEASGMESIDQAALEEYYSDASHLATLSLNPAYFSSAFSDAETIQIAQDTATALVGYIIETSSLQELLTMDDFSTSRQAWLNAIGVTDSIADLYLDTDQMQVEYSASYPFILKYENFTFYFEPTDWLTDADAVYHFLRDLFRGYDQMLTTIQTDEPEAYEMISENVKLPISIYFANSDTGNSETYSGQKIILTSSLDVWHEIGHIWSPRWTDAYWASEGVADLFSEFSGCELISYEESSFLIDFLRDESYAKQYSKMEQQFRNEVLAYCAVDDFNLNDGDEWNFSTLKEIMGAVTLVHPEIQTEITVASWSVLETNGGQKTENERDLIDPNNMTYPEALVFVKYLSEEYGLERVISIVQEGTSFETAFGVDYETALQACIDALKEHYES
jgi:hypothetical protein